MKTNEIIRKNDKELTALIAASQADIRKAYTELRTSQVSNVKTIANLKKTLARALTIERQRQIIAETEKKA